MLEPRPFVCCLCKASHSVVVDVVTVVVVVVAAAIPLLDYQGRPVL